MCALLGGLFRISDVRCFGRAFSLQQIQEGDDLLTLCFSAVYGGDCVLGLVEQFDPVLFKGKENINTEVVLRPLVPAPYPLRNSIKTPSNHLKSLTSKSLS